MKNYGVILSSGKLLNNNTNIQMNTNEDDLQPIDLDKILKEYRSEAYLNNLLKGHKKDLEYSYDQG